MKTKNEYNNYMRAYNRGRRADVIIKYGGRCKCCGESRVEFLAIDHTKGGGSKHLKGINGGIIPWLIKNKYPKGFRVLCHNCNSALGYYGYCPHKDPDASLKL